MPEDPKAPGNKRQEPTPPPVDLRQTERKPNRSGVPVGRAGDISPAAHLRLHQRIESGAGTRNEKILLYTISDVSEDTPLSFYVPASLVGYSVAGLRSTGASGTFLFSLGAFSARVGSGLRWTEYTGNARRILREDDEMGWSVASTAGTGSALCYVRLAAP